MKQFKSFVQKEFYHILRDKRSSLLLLAMPIVLMVIFGFAISNEIKNNSLAVYDMAKDDASQKIISSTSITVNPSVVGIESLLSGLCGFFSESTMFLKTSGDEEDGDCNFFFALSIAFSNSSRSIGFSK